MVLTLRAKNEFPLPKKSQKLGNFAQKKHHSTKGQFLEILIDVPCGFLMFFLVNQHQAMLILQGILFGTFTLVLAGNFPKLSKTVFYILLFRSLLRGLRVLCAKFLTFLS
jgi:hypothetical protein